MDRLTISSAQTLFGIESEPTHERIALVTDASSGLQAIIAIYSTTRGPSFGGCRLAI
jgi:leucine dehydrogenase